MQPGGQGALGGQVVFQVQDPPRGGQGAALVEQLPDPGGEGQLAAGIAAPPARRALRGHRARGIQGAQERLLYPEDLGGPPGGVGRVVRVIQVIEPSGYRRVPPQISGAARDLVASLDSFVQSALYKKYIGH